MAVGNSLPKLVALSNVGRPPQALATRKKNESTKLILLSARISNSCCKETCQSEREFCSEGTFLFFVWCTAVTRIC